jgi:hypothetical protein
VDLDELSEALVEMSTRMSVHANLDTHDVDIASEAGRDALELLQVKLEEPFGSDPLKHYASMMAAVVIMLTSGIKAIQNPGKEGTIQ